MSDPQMNDPQWERGVLEKVALAAIGEQRAARRWGMFFKMMVLLYLFAILFIGMGWFGKHDSLPGSHTALIDISGVISSGSPASADKIMSGLQAAFKDKNTKGFVIRINSPGGSPVQAGYIYDEIKRLRGLHSRNPVVCGDRRYLRLRRLLYRCCC